MKQTLALNVISTIKRNVTLTGFLKKVTYTEKELMAFFSAQEFIQGINNLLEKQDFSSDSLFKVVKKAVLPLDDDKDISILDVYDFLLKKVNEESRDRSFTRIETDFIHVFIAIYEVMLQEEEKSGSKEFYVEHSFQFLTKNEIDELEDDEYRRFQRAFKEDNIYALMKLSRDIYGFNTLDHVAGVHFVGMFIARQLKSLKLPLDLGRVSGALAGHDIGKYGVKLSEMNRVPYLHYYYSDIWFKKHGINYIRNIAVNHSTWDLELENLSLEALILIYSDFRVKNKWTDGKDEMHIYPLDESFDVILSKLDNVDEAKKKRYERVYEKLHDFEDYLISLGVETILSTKEENTQVIASKKEIQTLKKPAICFREEIIDRLKYHAIDHNVKVMDLLRNEYSMDTILEEARSLRDWRDLREYIRIFEEYSTYLTQGQKLQVIKFLMECLIHPEDDIRYHSAEILGKLLGSFDEDYRKELPLEEVAPSSNILGINLLNDLVKYMITPGHTVIDSHKYLLGYSFSTMVKSLYDTLPVPRREGYTKVLAKYYVEMNHKKQETTVFLLEAIKHIPFETEEKEFFLMKCFGGGTILQIASLEQITSMFDGNEFSNEFKSFLKSKVSSAGSNTEITNVFLYMRLAGQMGLMSRRIALEKLLKERTKELEAVFLNNLKTATHWIVKRNNIRLLLFYTLEDNTVTPLNTALHLCNLLKVSAIESVRRTAGNALLSLMRQLSPYERNEVSVELLRALEIEGHRFTEYIPKPLGKVLLYLNIKEFDEIIDDLLIKVKTANPSVKTLVIKTLGTTLESFIEFGMKSIELTEEEREKRIVSMVSVLLYGMADYESLAVRAAFTTIGKVIFASEVLSLKSKNQIFCLISKKLITLLSTEDKNLLFLCQSVGLNNIYRFMSEYLHAFQAFEFKDKGKYAFFPGTFDPFTLSHLAIARLIRDHGYEVYLAIDEFSWSKKTLPNIVRRNILNMSTAGELGLYLFPEDIPINISNPSDIRTLKEIFNHNVYMVCGSDVVLNASSYGKAQGEHTIHSLKHLLFERNRSKDIKSKIRKILPDVLFMDLPKDLKEISSSKIRTNIDENRDISTLIDPMAQSYIYLNGFYQKAQVDKSLVNLTFLEKKVYRVMDESLLSIVAKLFPKENAAILKLMEETFNKTSGRILTITDRNSGKTLGISFFHWARSENLLAEVKEADFADRIRKLNLGRIMVLDGLYVSSPDKIRNYHQILLTETLSFGVSRDYECALFLPKLKSLKDEKFQALLKLYNFNSLNYQEVVYYYVDMSTPIALNLDMENILKDPFRGNQRVRSIIQETRETLMEGIGNLYPGKLILPFEPLMLQQGIISAICEENSVPMEETKPRTLGDFMCVPYGDVLNRSVVPNTVTKSLHTEKYFNSDMEGFKIKEVPFYLNLENQVKTLSSFKRSVILVDTILHKGYRMNALNPLLKAQNIEVRKIIAGIVSAKGMDLMTSKDYKVHGVYYIPRLKVWFNEKDLYPFVGGDALWRGEFPKRNLIPSITLILPYTIPTFLLDAGIESIYLLSKVSIENSIKILKVIEEEFHQVYERKLTLSSLGQVFTMPRVPDKGRDIRYDLFKAPSYYLESDLEELLRLKMIVPKK